MAAMPHLRPARNRLGQSPSCAHESPDRRAKRSNAKAAPTLSRMLLSGMRNLATLTAARAATTASVAATACFRWRLVAAAAAVVAEVWCSWVPTVTLEVLTHRPKDKRCSARSTCSAAGGNGFSPQDD